MADELRFNIALTDAEGKRTPFSFTKAGLRDLIVQMLSIAAQVPVPPDLDRQLVLDDNPIPANGFIVTPLEDAPNGGHVSIGIGPLDLQFAVLLSDLLSALETLRAQTEPDPTSSHRPN